MGYSRGDFDRVVHATGYVHYCESSGNVTLNGEFTVEALSMISYALRNEPEWLKEQRGDEITDTL